jgi:hypothetical protein
MNNAKITVEEYNENAHGYCDDCDFVITAKISNQDIVLAEAMNIAELMGYSGMINRHSSKGVNYLFLCHA